MGLTRDKIPSQQTTVNLRLLSSSVMRIEKRLTIDNLSNKIPGHRFFNPKSILKMNTDARAATKAGKAFIAGEFEWNDANGGDALSNFLGNVQDNPGVACDAFFELWSHDDQYGYISGDQYTLHYPGDTAAMRSNVQLLRSYAYKMSNRPVPPDSLPGTPWLETVIRNGSTNTLIWQGIAVAASYTIERSTMRPN